MNNVTIIGNLTKDPEMKYMSNGKAVTNFSIAVNKKYKKDGKTKEDVSFFDVVCYDKRAETIEKYFRKGDRIGITGELKQRRWESQDGSMRSKTEITMRDFDFLSYSNTKENDNHVEDVSDDDIAF